MTGTITLSDARDASWDAIVIGAGMGGSAVAFSLAKKGCRVLVIERGQGAPNETGALSKRSEDPQERVRIGRWPTKLSGTVDARSFDFFAPLGTGVGGSSLLYAAALDRFRRSDFEPRPHPDGSTLAWPIDYENFAPFYDRAEELLNVTGDADPLSDMPVKLAAPEPMSDRDADLFARFQKAGLNPYRLHSGYRYSEECGTCFGRVCLVGCKQHGGNAFMEPAVATGRVAVLAEASVERLEADQSRVTAASIHRAGEAATLVAPLFVLAAGTYFSPVVLLKSASEAWPNGLGNHNDQVGRHLMFHTGRSLAVWAGRGKRHEGSGKTIVFRDFYDTPEGKFGEVQSTGAEAAYGNVVYALRQMLATSRFARVPLLWHLARIPAFAASRLLGNAAIFELIMEDLPYSENRVVLEADAPSGMRFHYRIPNELQERFEAYSQGLSKKLKGVRHIWLNYGTGLNYGHPMGTCRIGDDPKTSVAGAEGRVHGLDNLYVSDGSFMPSAGGTNPSLTIAAHGLRTGGLIAAGLRS